MQNAVKVATQFIVILTPNNYCYTRRETFKSELPMVTEMKKKF